MFTSNRTNSFFRDDLDIDTRNNTNNNYRNMGLKKKDPPILINKDDYKLDCVINPNIRSIIDPNLSKIISKNAKEDSIIYNFITNFNDKYFYKFRDFLNLYNGMYSFIDMIYNQTLHESSLNLYAGEEILCNEIHIIKKLISYNFFAFETYTLYKFGMNIVNPCNETVMTYMNKLSFAASVRLTICARINYIYDIFERHILFIKPNRAMYKLSEEIKEYAIPKYRPNTNRKKSYINYGEIFNEYYVI